jgi:phosphoserine aminotransferase
MCSADDAGVGVEEGSPVTRKINFSSGPAVLPEEVLRRAQQALWDLEGSGIGILEHSHRGPEFGRVLDRTDAVIREVGGIDDNYAVLFVTAGATHHFAMVPQSFLGSSDVADYCHTGVWSGKAIADARRFGTVQVACTAEPDFTQVPRSFAWSQTARYAHYTSNETIYGTQWREPPPSPAPLVCDASSDIFSRPLTLANHALIYAGAQKNLGPSGISLVIARRDFLETGRSDLPALAQYRTYAAERSLHNTPNTFGIYMIGEVVGWIRDQGGLPAMAERNARKAAVLYDFLDHSKRWRGHAHPDSRSTMNVTFRGDSPALEEALLARAEQQGLANLRGHRSVGGLRASLYNAFPEEGVHRLVALLHEVERDG